MDVTLRVLVVIGLVAISMLDLLDEPLLLLILFVMASFTDRSTPTGR